MTILKMAQVIMILQQFPNVQIGLGYFVIAICAMGSIWGGKLILEGTETKKAPHESHSSVRAPNFNLGNQFIADQMYVNFQGNIHQSQVWRTLDVSSVVPPVPIATVTLVFDVDKGKIEGLVRAQGSSQTYSFDSEDAKEVTIPVRSDQRIFEYTLKNSSITDTRFHVKLKGFEFAADFFSPQAQGNSRRKQEEVKWDFSGYFLGMNAVSGADIHVSSFQLKGKNLSGVPIKKISGILRSDITNEELPLLLESMPPDETDGIPIDCEFWVQSLFRDTKAKREGISEVEFLKKFGGFSFVFIYDGKVFQRKFEYQEIYDLIEKFRRESNPPPKPSVVRKKDHRISSQEIDSIRKVAVEKSASTEVALFKKIDDKFVFQTAKAETNPSPKKDELGKASIIFKLKNFEIIDGYNISAITDNGMGDVFLTFDTDFENENYYVYISGNKSINYQIVQKEKSGLRIKFHEDQVEQLQVVCSASPLTK